MHLVAPAVPGPLPSLRPFRHAQLAPSIHSQGVFILSFRPAPAHLMNMKVVCVTSVQW